MASPVVFVAPHLKMGSARLRAVQISEELVRRGADSRVVPSSESVRNATLIFIKGDDVANLRAARNNGNRVVVDLIDPHQRTFAEAGRGRLFFHQVDPSLLNGALFVNSRSLASAGEWASAVPCAVIPHPRDDRFVQPPNSHNHFSLLSLGHSSDPVTHPSLTHISLTNHVLTASMIERARGFSCHLSVRDLSGSGSRERFGEASLRFHSKSNIKAATAAACGANIITSRDAGSLEVLPDQYPFWYDDETPLAEAIERAADAFDGPQWRLGLDIMAAVREATSTRAVTDRYQTFLSNL